MSSRQRSKTNTTLHTQTTFTDQSKGLLLDPTECTIQEIDTWLKDVKFYEGWASILRQSITTTIKTKTTTTTNVTTTTATATDNDEKTTVKEESTKLQRIFLEWIQSRQQTCDLLKEIKILFEQKLVAKKSSIKQTTTATTTTGKKKKKKKKKKDQKMTKTEMVVDTAQENEIERICRLVQMQYEDLLVVLYELNVQQEFMVGSKLDELWAEHSKVCGCARMICADSLLIS